MITTRSPGTDAERGATALEFALVAPLLFLMLFAGIEAGRLLHVASAFRSAIADAARCAELGRPACRDRAGMASTAEERMRALGAAATIPRETLILANAPCGLQVEAELAYPPLLLPASLLSPRLRARACAGLPE
jgi:Flp pilus assembly pilin Flp